MINIKRSFAAISLITMALPWNVMAATPTQSLDKAIKAMENTASYKLDMDLKVNVKQEPPSSMTAHLNTRMLNKQNGEGDFTFSAIPFTLNQPIGMNWKMAGTMLYFQVNQVPNVITDYLKTNLDIDPTAIIGTWIGMEASTGFSEIKNMSVLPTEAISNGLPQSVAAQSAIKKLPIFTVTRVEKKSKNSSGDEIQRLRVRINPTLISAVRLAEIKSIPHDKNYTKNLITLNKRYAELRANLTKVFMAVNLNVTKNRVERMEIGGTIEKSSISMGINLSPTNTDPIIAPSSWKTIQEIQTLLMPPTPTDPLMQTLTNTGA